jgi:phage gp29-like protein
MSETKESLAAEFQRLHSAWQKAWDVESDQIGMPITEARADEVHEFATEHGDLIARALRLLEVCEKDDDAFASSMARRMWDRALQTVDIAPTPEDHYAFAGRAVLAALLEAVK